MYCYYMDTKFYRSLELVQEENKTFGTFFSRTNYLAETLGVGILDLKKIMGVSQGVLFRGRKNDDDITAKTWLKLEAAERKAGITTLGKVPNSSERAKVFTQSIEETNDLLREIAGHLKAIAEKPTIDSTVLGSFVKKVAKSGKINRT